MNNNKDPKILHETILKDIMDIWDGIKDFANSDKLSVSKKGPMVNSSSIANASSNLNLVFPVICSKGISIETSSMISKAIEKDAVTMLQRLFASWQIADNNVKSVEDYIKTFHTNISSNISSLDDIFAANDKLAESSTLSLTLKEETEMINSIKKDLGNLNYHLPSAINETSLIDFCVKEGAVGGGRSTKKTESESEAKYKDSSVIKNYSDYFKNQVANSEFKKANELMPTMMTINFKVKSDSGEHDYTNAIIGVKAKLYPISSDDVVKHISEKTTNRSWITNFFRATTREISFMKDFVLALDKAKIDAISMSTRKNTTDRMWKVLERRATISRLKKALRQNNTAAAITTLCVSQEEVECLRKYHNINLENVSTIIGLFNSLNLMAICIVDESLEVAKFIYDEQEPMWQTISFTHLERESSDSTYKRVVNLMTKISR